MDFHSVLYLILLGLAILVFCPMLEAAKSQGSATASKPVCGEEVCGNFNISLPFGIEAGCYTNTWFRVTCSYTGNGYKPYLHRLKLEILDFTSTSLLVNNPVTYVDCPNRNGTTSVNLKRSPFFFPFYSNFFGSVGCGNLATVFGNRTDPLAGCLQTMCGDGASKSGCFVTINEDLTSYSVNMTPVYSNSNSTAEGGSKRCASGFLFDTTHYLYADNYPIPRDINVETTHVAASLEWKSFECDLKGPICQGPATAPLKSKGRKPCGAVDIAYPFGIDHGDYMDDRFRVTCNRTGNDTVPYIHSINLQLLKVSFSEATVEVNYPITYFNCDKNRNHINGISVNLKNSSFYFSEADNIFWSPGCGNLATVFDYQTDHPIGGCLQQSCRTITDASSVNGCFIYIPHGLSSFSANMTKLDSSSSSKRSCGFASVVRGDFFVEWNSKPELRELTHVPATLRWGTPMTGLCRLKEGFNTLCSPDRQYCWQNLSHTHLCVCSIDSKPTLSSDECLDAKCGNSKYRFCHMLCLNTPHNYCSSEYCPPEFEYNRTSYRCEPKNITSSMFSPAVFPENIRNLVIIIGTIVGTILLLLGTWLAFKVFKRRQNVLLKQKYFKRNGGLLLQQHLSSNKGNVEKIKLFTSKEMEKATDYYNENRILGQGGQGTVYKGMLADGSIVAIKKTKLMDGKKFDVKKVEQFINEVIILSHVNHRYVVKLLGCCLEAQVPLLVYEFIPNGTLYDLIQCQNEEFPLTWEIRLRIAIDIANALFYLHSAASLPIYHRDIKSSNILLADKYRGKVSDFGISRSIALEQTHLTTRVQGTFGYMDPEYFRSSQFTEKSDVYSFGVVLVELITGQKPISSQQSEEVRSLVSFFLVSMEENSLFDILDEMVLKNGLEQEIIAVAKLEKRCLNLNGKKRPTIKQVAIELELIKASEHVHADQESGDEESETDEIIESSDIYTSCSTSRSITTCSVTVPLNTSF